MTTMTDIIITDRLTRTFGQFTAVNALSFSVHEGEIFANIKAKTIVLLEKLQLEREADQLVGALPLGWKQKLALSVALLYDPKIVFLDEPTSDVDPLTRRQFWDLIYDAARTSVTLMVTTHYMDEVFWKLARGREKISP